MTTREKYLHWLKLAQYDMDTAEAMLNSGRWLYVVVMCQQAIEKLCKGLYVLYVDDDVPRIHNIRGIIEKFATKLPYQYKDDYNKLFDKLTSFYIQGRYPEYDDTYSDIDMKSEAKDAIEMTKEAFTWLLTLEQ